MKLSITAGRMAGLWILLTITAHGGLAQDTPPHPGGGARYLEFSCSFGSDEEQRAIVVPLKLPSSVVAGDLNQEVELPEPRTPIRLLRYIPLAVPHQRIEVDPSPNAPSAVRLSIDGPKLSYQRCLIAGNPVRNRMTSLIGTWRYVEATRMGQRDTLFASFEQEPKRAPQLTISRKGNGLARTIPSSVGTEESILELACTVRVLQFLPHYSYDQMMGKVVNLSQKRRNPAVFVEIEGPEGKEEQWIFARFPDYEAEGSEAFRYKVTLDCPVEKEKPTPDFVVVAIEKTAHEVWLRHGEKVTSRALPVGERVEIPSSQYTFHIACFLPAAALIEDYQETERSPSAVTVLQIAYTDSRGKPATRWLELNQEYTLACPEGSVRVSFRAPGRSPGENR